MLSGCSINLNDFIVNPDAFKYQVENSTRLIEFIKPLFRCDEPHPSSSIIFVNAGEGPPLYPDLRLKIMNLPKYLFAPFREMNDDAKSEQRVRPLDSDEIEILKSEMLEVIISSIDLEHNALNVPRFIKAYAYYRYGGSDLSINPSDFLGHVVFEAGAPVFRWDVSAYYEFLDGQIVRFPILKDDSFISPSVPKVGYVTDYVTRELSTPSHTIHFHGEGAIIPYSLNHPYDVESSSSSGLVVRHSRTFRGFTFIDVGYGSSRRVIPIPSIMMDFGFQCIRQMRWAFLVRLHSQNYTKPVTNTFCRAQLPTSIAGIVDFIIDNCQGTHYRQFLLSLLNTMISFIVLPVLSEDEYRLVQKGGRDEIYANLTQILFRSKERWGVRGVITYLHEIKPWSVFAGYDLHFSRIIGFLGSNRLEECKDFMFVSSVTQRTFFCSDENARMAHSVYFRGRDIHEAIESEVYVIRAKKAMHVQPDESIRWNVLGLLRHIERIPCSWMNPWTESQRFRDEVGLHSSQSSLGVLVASCPCGYEVRSTPEGYEGVKVADSNSKFTGCCASLISELFKVSPSMSSNNNSASSAVVTNSEVNLRSESEISK